MFDLTPDEIRARQRYWRSECLDVYESHEFKWVKAGIEPSIDDEVEMNKDGWHLGGLKGMRHYARPKKTRHPIIITAMTVPNPLWAATVAVLASCVSPRFVIWLDPSLKKPRVRVRAPSERISMEEYFMLGSQWKAGEITWLKADILTGVKKLPRWPEPMVNWT